MKEIWREVPGFKGFYEVSHLGNVRSVTRTVRCRGASKRWPGRLLKSNIDANGYCSVALSKFGKVTRAKIHTLVLSAFVGPAHGLEACHFDGNKRNNSLPNLRWDTRKANFLDRVRLGENPRGLDRPNSKLTVAQAAEILADSSSSGVFLAAKYGVSSTTIHNVRYGKHWTNASKRLSGYTRREY